MDSNSNYGLNYYKNYCFFLIFFAITAPAFLCSQTSATKADTYFSNKNYIDALDLYKNLFEQEPDNIDYNYKLSLCYLNTYCDRTKAIRHLEYICNKKNNDPEMFFSLGLAYQFANQTDNAIAAFSKAKKIATGKFALLIDRQIETCFNGRELMKFPLDVSFTKISDDINSNFPEYNPLIPKDETFMIFTARKPEKTNVAKELDGYYPSDIYISYLENGIWTKGKTISSRINTAYDEQAVDLTSSGEKMIVYIDRVDSLGNVYVSENQKMGFQTITKITGKINEGFETAASISESEDMIVFASERKEGFGGRDLYVSLKLPNGSWGQPQNLGPSINTIYNEDFPHLSFDQKTLLFASEGHSSMGGYDIFKTINRNNSWLPPQNIGYPINDAYDQMNISYSFDSTIAYMSKISTVGGLKIHKIKFNRNVNRYRIVRGAVSVNDTTLNLDDLKAIIYAESDQIENTLKFKPNKKNGSYIMALIPGKYKIKIAANGFNEMEFKLTIFDSPFQSELVKDFILTPLKKE